MGSPDLAITEDPGPEGGRSSLPGTRGKAKVQGSEGAKEREGPVGRTLLPEGLRGAQRLQRWSPGAPRVGQGPGVLGERSTKGSPTGQGVLVDHGDVPCVTTRAAVGPRHEERGREQTEQALHCGASGAATRGDAGGLGPRPPAPPTPPAARSRQVGRDWWAREGYWLPQRGPGSQQLQGNRGGPLVPRKRGLRWQSQCAGAHPARATF